MSNTSPEVDKQYYARTLPEGERNWGFRVQELDPKLRLGRPIDDVIANHKEKLDAARRYVLDGMVAFTNDENDIEAVDLPVDVCLPAKIREHLEDGASAGHTLNGRPIVADPELRLAVDIAERNALVDSATSSLVWKLDSACSTVGNIYLSMASVVSQVFEVSNGRGANFRIYNFTKTLLEGEALHKMLNALRAMDDFTGGRSTEDVWDIAITPEETPAWSSPSKGAVDAGAIRTLGASSSTGGIALNEVLLKKPEDMVDNDLIVGGGVELTLFHELTHIIENRIEASGGRLPSEDMGWDIPRNSQGFIDRSRKPIFNGAQKSPSKYGETEPSEDVAETALAMFRGGDWADGLARERHEAIANLYTTRRTERENDIKQGPAYLTCVELDLMRCDLDGKFGTRLPNPIRFRPQMNYYFSTEP